MELTLGVVCLDKDVMLAVNISHVSHYSLENLVRTICSYKEYQFCVALFFFFSSLKEDRQVTSSRQPTLPEAEKITNFYLLVSLQNIG